LRPPRSDETLPRLTVYGSRRQWISRRIVTNRARRGRADRGAPWGSRGCLADPHQRGNPGSAHQL